MIGHRLVSNHGYLSYLLLLLRIHIYRMMLLCFVLYPQSTTTHAWLPWRILAQRLAQLTNLARGAGRAHPEQPAAQAVPDFAGSDSGIPLIYSLLQDYQ